MPCDQTRSPPSGLPTAHFSIVSSYRMSAPLASLVRIRSQLAEEVLAYLHALAERMAELPAYYPKHLRETATGRTPFDHIRQVVQVVEDRSAFERWLAEERERTRAAGLDFEHLAYQPARARPELGEDDEADRQHRDRPEPPPPVAWDEHAGRRFKRAVILGDPGFGKTWLLRYEARRLAHEAIQALEEQTKPVDEIVLPIFARLSDLSHGKEPLQQTLVKLACAGRSRSFAEFIRGRLKTDRCVILLDAWDEVPVEIPKMNNQAAGRKLGFQQYLAAKLEEFAQQFSAPRLLLTSRIVGYGRCPIPQAQELELLAFESPQMDAFARVWFDGNPQPAAPSAATNAFLAMLRQNHQVRGLARIPLMLALICRAWTEAAGSSPQSEARSPKVAPRFPTRRVELYERCLHGLLLEWKEQRDQWCHSEVQLTALLARLARGAFELFRQQREQFKEPELAKAMGFDLKDKQEIEEADDLIAGLKHDGVLISVGEGLQAPRLFLHRTFHEYLAASHLASEMEGTNDGRTSGNQTAEATWEYVDRKAWDPKWEQVIVLLAGILQDPIPLLKRLADAGRDDLFLHRLCLAALCLPEVASAGAGKMSHGKTECSTTTATAFAELRDSIASQVFDLWEKQREQGYQFSHVRKSVCVAIQVNQNLLDRWTKALRHPNWEVRHRAAWELGLRWRAAAIPEVVAPLAEALRDPYWRVRSWAAEILGWMGNEAATTDVLLHGLSQRARRVAEEALRQMGSAAATQEVLAWWAERLRDPDRNVRHDAALALERMGRTAVTPEILAALTEGLQGWDRDVREMATELLGQAGSAAATPQVLATLMQGICELHSDARRKAATMQGEVESTTATPHVMAWLKESLDDWFGFQNEPAAQASEPLGNATATQDVLARLTERLRDAREVVRARAVEALGLLGSAAATPDVLMRLCAGLQDTNEVVRAKAAEALGRMGTTAATPWVLAGLIERLRDPEKGVREKAAAALGDMGSAAATPEVMEQLLRGLNDRATSVRWRAAAALAQMESAAEAPEMPAWLTQRLGDPSWPEGARAEVLARLIVGLRDAEQDVRWRAAKALDSMTQEVRVFQRDSTISVRRIAHLVGED